MQEVKRYPPATFSWIDLATTNPEAAKQFYTQLFGWTFDDMPVNEDGSMVYTMLKLNGLDVAALSAMPPGMEGIPPHWSSYITVDNLEESIAQAEAAGGTVTMPAMDVLDAGRMAGIQDPTGATFYLWQPGTHIGAKLVNMPGALCWNELLTHDTAKAGQYYSKLFGWSIKKDPHSDYLMFDNNGHLAGGMMQIQPEWGEMPSHWSVYFAVEDCDKSAVKAAALGGTVLNPPSDIPGTGRFALLQDPQGAIFNIVKMERFDPPPAG